MIKKENSLQVYIESLCERCGSKKRVSKTWKEKIPTYSGTTEVEYSQIICVNRICQAAFEKTLIEDQEKRNAIKLKKETNDRIRKASSLSQLHKERKI